MITDQPRYRLRMDVVSSPDYDIYGHVTEIELDFFAIVDTYTGEDLYTLTISPRTRLTEATTVHGSFLGTLTRLNEDHDAYLRDIISLCS